MASLETIVARRAALLLHSLLPKDRERVMARLPLPDRDRMQALLRELQALGVPRSLGRSFADLGSEAHMAAQSGQSIVEQLCDHTAPVMARALQGCSPMTTACVLRSRSWPWGCEVLELLPASHRVAVFECMRKDVPQLAPAALDILYERLNASAVALLAAARDAPARRVGMLAQLGGRIKKALRWTP